jgi:hypothetical protein
MIEVGIAALLERPCTESKLSLPACVIKFPKQPDEEQIQNVLGETFTELTEEYKGWNVVAVYALGMGAYQEFCNRNLVV